MSFGVIAPRVLQREPDFRSKPCILIQTEIVNVERPVDVVGVNKARYRERKCLWNDTWKPIKNCDQYLECKIEQTQELGNDIPMARTPENTVRTRHDVTRRDQTLKIGIVGFSGFSRVHFDYLSVFHRIRMDQHIEVSHVDQCIRQVIRILRIRPELFDDIFQRRQGPVLFEPIHLHDFEYNRVDYAETAHAAYNRSEAAVILNQLDDWITVFFRISDPVGRFYSI